MQKVVKKDGRVRHYYEEFDEVVDVNNKTHLVDKILKINDKVKVICKDGSVLDVENVKPSQHTMDLCKTISKSKEEEVLEITLTNGSVIKVLGEIQNIKSSRGKNERYR